MSTDTPQPRDRDAATGTRPRVLILGGGFAGVGAAKAPDRGGAR